MVTKKQDVILVGVGDVRPQRSDPPSIFSHCGDVFQTADISFGQMESPMSDRGTPMFTPHAPGKRSPKNITALTEKGGRFTAMSFACNHAMDWGPDAFFDTIDLLTKNNIAVVGAGKNLSEARKPAIIEKKGTKFGFLANLTIVIPGLIAEEDVPGCVPLRATHCYEHIDFQPGTPPLILTKLFPEDKKMMEDDIKKLRPQVDILVFSMHCGVHMVPALLPMYQKEAAYAAIDAGADLVLMHHAHILKGIEVYKGKVIFYGLGNFAIDQVGDFIPNKIKAFDPAYRKLREIYHIKPIPGWEKYPYLPDARNTMIAKAYNSNKKIQKVTYIPAYISPKSEPEVVTRKDPRAQGCYDYVQQISDSQDLKVAFSWEGDEVLISGVK
jgi:poly-gamma-glutamate synthesis protein (capsule biosynthesis protein)